jgi:AbiV family abortive infection protein
MDNYYDTAKRMQKSSKILFNNQEYHNSCYLAGYVIECYSKIIIGLSYGLNNTNDLKEFGHDLKEMNKMLQYILNHSSFSTYIKDLKVEFEKITKGMSRWNPTKRYSNISNQWSFQNAQDYQNEISVAMQIIAQIRNDGHTLI